MVSRKNHGGSRPGSGRKSKAEEQSLIEKIGPLEPLAFNALRTALENGDRWAVKMFFEYMYGRPTAKVNGHIIKERPVFKIERQIVANPIYSDND